MKGKIVKKMKRFFSALLGSGISANYDNVNPIFTIGYWKVHSAVNKTTHDRVSLWLIDQEKITAEIQDQAVRDKYLSGSLAGIQKLRKLRHPHLLKILEVQESTSSLGFASEPISSSLQTLIGSLNGDDASYICFQLADAMQFLHNNAKMAHLGISPEAIFLDENLSVKLFNFDWSVPINGTKDINLLFTQYFTEITYPPLPYSSPEVVQCRQSTCLADVFSFALVFYECISGKPLLLCKDKREYDIGRNPILSISGIGTNYMNLFRGCLNIDASTRPDFTNILESEAFATMQMKILRYLEMIIAKDPKDKFVFFKNLAKTIDQFSPMMNRCRILPLLISESKADIRFAPVLLGSIFNASAKFTVSEFTDSVFKQIAFLMKVTDPPQVSIALLQNLPLILDKTDSKLHAENVYPIIFNALQSNNDVLQKECLKKLPLVVEKMNETSIQTGLLPKLVELITAVQEPAIVSSAINCITICLGKSDNENFLRTQLTKVYEAWRKHQSASVASAICAMIEKVKASHKTMMNRAVPFAADVISNSATEAYVQKRLCNWMLSTINAYKQAGKLDEAQEPEQIALDNLAAKTSTPSKFEDYSKNSANSLASFNFGFDSTPSATPQNSQPKNDNLSFNTDFSSPQPKKNTADFGTPQTKQSSNAGFPSPQPSTKQNTTDFGAFNAQPKSFNQQPKNDFNAFNQQPKNDFAVFNQQPKNDFNAFNQQPKNDFNAFNQQQKNDFQPFGQQSPQQQMNRPMRTVPQGNGMQLSPQGPPRNQPQSSSNNNTFNLF